MTDWKEGAVDARETMEKPEARTANDWKRPVTARTPAERDDVTSRPVLRTMNAAHSMALWSQTRSCQDHLATYDLIYLREQYQNNDEKPGDMGREQVKEASAACDVSEKGPQMRHI